MPRSEKEYILVNVLYINNNTVDILQLSCSYSSLHAWHLLTQQVLTLLSQSLEQRTAIVRELGALCLHVVKHWVVNQKLTGVMERRERRVQERGR